MYRDTIVQVERDLYREHEGGTLTQLSTPFSSLSSHRKKATLQVSFVYHSYSYICKACPHIVLSCAPLSATHIITRVNFFCTNWNTQDAPNQNKKQTNACFPAKEGDNVTRSSQTPPAQLVCIAGEPET